MTSRRARPGSRSPRPAAANAAAANGGVPSGLRVRHHTFFGAPPRDETAAARSDVAFLGAPFDLGTTLRPGARFGPDAIRAASAWWQYARDEARETAAGSKGALPAVPSADLWPAPQAQGPPAASRPPARRVCPVLGVRHLATRMRPYDLIRAKRDGEALPPETIQEFVAAFMEDDVSDAEMAAFLMAVYFKGLSAAETAALTRSPTPAPKSSVSRASSNA